MKVLRVSLILSLLLANVGANGSNFTCGVSSRNVSALSRVQQGDFPWMASLILNNSENGSQSYLCGGVLISEKRVLTAAHCVHNAKRFYFPSDILVVFGGHDISKSFEANRIVAEAKAIYVHHNWLPFNQNFDADIAVVVLKRSIQFSEFVLPICMWNSKDAMPATSGVIIGYGMNGNRSEMGDKKGRVPKKIQIFIHRNEECIAAEPRLKALSSDRTLCGESIYGNFVCTGDSGHGFFVRIKDRHYLRAIISSSPKAADGACTYTHYGVYSNVQMYRGFIEHPDAAYPGSAMCGLMSASQGLVQGGKVATREQFPWIASVVYHGGFNTSAILVSHKHVLVHAGGVSFWDEGKREFIVKPVTTFQVYLGAVQSIMNDEHSIVANPSKVVLHPHLKTSGGTLVNAIAVVTLENEVKFTKFIRSACLWTFENDDLNTLRNAPLYGAGYGRDETGHNSNRRKFVRMSLAKDEKTCREIYVDRNEAFDEATLFCAQGESNSTPCESDTSLLMKFNDKWYIRGVMLTYRKWTANGTCVYGKPLLYEDIAKHSQWIISQMK